jgi:hypothetical protein
MEQYGDGSKQLPLPKHWLVLCLTTYDVFKVDTHYTDVTWDRVTSDAVSRMGLLQLLAECSRYSHVTW